jgi:hypothetical protein
MRFYANQHRYCCGIADGTPVHRFESSSSWRTARYGLGPKSSVQRALAGLAADDWLTREGNRYVFVDSLYREYVLRETR